MSSDSLSSFLHVWQCRQMQAVGWSRFEQGVILQQHFRGQTLSGENGTSCGSQYSF